MGTSMKMVVIAMYMPPNYTVPRGNFCLEHIENLVKEIKKRYNDQFIVLGGDFNQWQADCPRRLCAHQRGTRRADEKGS